MVDVQTEITISKPLGTVAEYAMNPDNAQEWYVNIKYTEWQTPNTKTPRPGFKNRLQSGISLTPDGVHL